MDTALSFTQLYLLHTKNGCKMVEFTAFSVYTDHNIKTYAKMFVKMGFEIIKF